MRAFNVLFVKSECPNCPNVIEAIIKINKKLPFNKKIKIKNIRDLEKFDVNFYNELLNNINLKGTPYLCIGEIKNGKIIELANIIGGYPKELIEANLNGLLNDDFLEKYKGVYAEEELMYE